MGLDAHVCCRCIEDGKLLKPLPNGWTVLIAEEGHPYIDSADLREQMAFDDWLWRSCEHDDQRLVHRRLGNMSSIGFLRDGLGEASAACPVLLGKVLYSGIHGGDWLVMEDVERLAGELDALRTMRFGDEKLQSFISVLLDDLWALVTASLRVRKPIVF